MMIKTFSVLIILISGCGFNGLEDNKSATEDTIVVDAKNIRTEEEISRIDTIDCDSLKYYINNKWESNKFARKVIQNCSKELEIFIEKASVPSELDLVSLNIICEYSDGDLADLMGGTVIDISKSNLSAFYRNDLSCLDNRLISELQFAAFNSSDLTEKDYFSYLTWLHEVKLAKTYTDWAELLEGFKGTFKK